MSAETVIRKIEEKADAEIQAIYADAKAKADAREQAILAEATRRGEAIRREAQVQAELTLRSASQQAVLSVRIDSLGAKRRELDAVRARVKQAMLAFDAPRQAALMERLVLENGMAGESQLRVPKGQEGRYPQTLLAAWSRKLTEKLGQPAAITLAAEAAPIDGGAILCAEHYDVDLSYGALLDEAFQAREREIAESLFSAGAEEA